MNEIKTETEYPEVNYYIKLGKFKNKLEFQRKISNLEIDDGITKVIYEKLPESPKIKLKEKTLFEKIKYKLWRLFRYIVYYKKYYSEDAPRYIGPPERLCQIELVRNSKTRLKRGNIPLYNEKDNKFLNMDLTDERQ